MPWPLRTSTSFLSDDQTDVQTAPTVPWRHVEMGPFENSGLERDHVGLHLYFVLCTNSELPWAEAVFPYF